MAQKNYKKILTAGLVALALGVSGLVVNRTNAVFPGTGINGKIVFGTDNGKALKASMPDGSGAVELYRDNNASILGDPAWSPDKSKIVFSVLKSGQQHLYTINGTDANQTATQLTTGAGQSGAVDPAWSPDGQHIVFSRNVSNVSNLFVMDDDGANQEQLTNYTNTDVQAYDPHWSPVTGSRKIVYNTASYVFSPPTDSDVRIAEINAGYDDLSSDVLLEGASWNATDDDADQVRGEYDPQFSPDGTKVLFVRKTSGGSYSIGTVPADGSSSTYTTIVSNAVLGGPVYDPAFSPDGKFVVYVKAANLLSHTTTEIFEVANGAKFTLTSNGSEPDWTYASEEEEPEDLPDVSVECTTEVGKPCIVTIPEFCINTLLTAPARGTSVITGNSLTYTPTANSNEEENYVHSRTNGVSSAKCNVKIKFTSAGIIPQIPKTGIVGGLAGLGLAAAIAGSAIYAKEYRNNKAKKADSEK